MKKKMIKISLLLGFFAITNTTKGMWGTQVAPINQLNPMTNMPTQQQNQPAYMPQNQTQYTMQNQIPETIDNAPQTIFDQERHYKDKMKYQRKIKALQLLAIELANACNQFNEALQSVAITSGPSISKLNEITNNKNNNQGWIKQVAKIKRTDLSPTVGGAQLYMQQQYEMKNDPQIKAN